MIIFGLSFLPIFQHSRRRDPKELQALDDTFALRYHDNGGSAEDFPCENNPQLLLFHNIVLDRQTHSLSTSNCMFHFMFGSVCIQHLQQDGEYGVHTI